MRGWVPIPRFLVSDLPLDRPYSRVEAAYSIALDRYEGRVATLRAYARLWQWSPNRVSRFLNELEANDKKLAVSIKHEAKQKRDTRGTEKHQDNSILLVNAEQQRNADGTVMLAFVSKISETEADQKRNRGKTPNLQEYRELQGASEQQRDRCETDAERILYEKTKEDTFGQFWSAYPKKKDKGGAFKIWQQIQPSPETVAAILAALDWQRQQPDWQKDAGRFIPHPSTWLNGRRWEDENPNAASLAPTEPRRLQVVL